MKELVEYIVKCLVKDKDSVQVREAEENDELVLYVSVAEDDGTSYRTKRQNCFKHQGNIKVRIFKRKQKSLC